MKFCRQKNNNIKNVGNNKIIINSKYKKELNIEVYGSNNEIIVETEGWFECVIYVGLPDCPVTNCKVFIGRHSTSNGLVIRLLEDNSYVHVGEDCMFSSGVSLYCSDTHSIVDDSNNLINIGRSIDIGNHVWLGEGVKVVKNTSIPDNCVVGLGSIVTKKFKNPNCILAGNPAKIVKENVNWDKRRPKHYLEENISYANN